MFRKLKETIRAIQGGHKGDGFMTYEEVVCYLQNESQEFSDKSREECEDEVKRAIASGELTIFIRPKP